MRRSSTADSASSLKPARSEHSPGIVGAVTVPGDKSISHRALILGSQILGRTVIDGLLEGEDVLNTAAALRDAGVYIESDTGSGTWQISGVGVGGLACPRDVLNMGNAGTGVRLLMGLFSSYPYTVFFTGDASLRRRPMERVMAPLRQLGAQFVAGAGSRLPLALIGTAAPLPVTYRMSVPSAQVKSAVLLAALNTPGTTSVIETVPTRDHTERMLEFLEFPVARVRLDDGTTSVSVSGQPAQSLHHASLKVPGDPSSAAFLIVAALITPGSDITIRNVCINPLRTGLFTTLEQMGAQIEIMNRRQQCGEEVADIRTRHSSLRSVTVPASRAPSMIDEYPILAVAASHALGATRMEGLAELRVKESDRLKAILDGLSACGVRARGEGDTLIVEGSGRPPSGGGTVTVHGDHRIAMAFLVLGLASIDAVQIDDTSSIGTSFPDFVSLLNSLGGRVSAYRAEGSRPAREPGDVIAVDGPAASGKGTLARRLAEHLGYDYLDTGSLYRAVGMKLIYANEDPSDPVAALRAAQSITENDLLNPRLRQERVARAASIISAMPEVRKALLDYQREFARRPNGAVLDGRDIGTVVCPEARLKIFITANMENRARRRHRELEGEGIRVDYQSVLAELGERDQRDRERAVAPLKPADDAIVIDTSHMDAQMVFDYVVSLIRQQG